MFECRGSRPRVLVVVICRLPPPARLVDGFAWQQTGAGAGTQAAELRLNVEMHSIGLCERFHLILPQHSTYALSVFTSIVVNMAKSESQSMHDEASLAMKLTPYLIHCVPHRWIPRSSTKLSPLGRARKGRKGSWRWKLFLWFG